MLILGIETATEQVGCAIGGHEGVLGVFALDAGPAPRRDPHAGHRVRVPPGRVGLARSAAWRSTSARACSPACASVSPPAKAIAQALRVPMIGVASLDLLAFPLRYATAIAAVIDARRGELFYACYRQCRAACSGSRSPPSAARRPRRRSVAARRRAACWSATAPCATPSALAGRPASRWPTGRPTRRRPRSCSWPTPRRCARSGCNPWELEPLYLRKPDAEINWPPGTRRPR